MTVSWKMTRDQEGGYDLEFANGRIVTEPAVNSVVKHTILCRGRVDANTMPIRERRGGFIGDIPEINNELSFSNAWIYYKQSPNNTSIFVKDAITSALLNNPEVIRLQQLGNEISVQTSSVGSALLVNVTIGNNIINFSL